MHFITLPFFLLVVHCSQCNIDIPQSKYIGHLRSNQHKSNSQILLEKGVYLLQQAFRNRIASYQIKLEEDDDVDDDKEEGKRYKGVLEFLDNLKPRVINLIQYHLNIHGNLKINVELFGNYVLQSEELEEIKSFNTKSMRVTLNDDLCKLYDDFVKSLEKKTSDFAEKDSGMYFISTFLVDFHYIYMISCFLF